MGSDHSEADSADMGDSVVHAWSRNRTAAIIVVGLTLLCVGVVLLLTRRVDRATLLLSCRCQLFLMALAAPVVLWRAAHRIDALVRVGAMSDGFGLFLLVVAIFSPALTVGRAIGVYLILLTVVLLGVGVFTTLRLAGLVRVLAVGGSGITLLAIAMAAFVPLPSRINVDLAMQDLLQVGPTQTDWLITALVLAAAGGMVWTAGYLVEHHRANGWR
jgi:hypothetical protein